MIPRVLNWSDLRALHWRGKSSSPHIPSLIFLHGIGDGADIWRPVLSAWPGKLHPDAYAIDLPGHGGSSSLDPAKYSVETIASMIATALNENDIKYPILVGHSLGARVVMHMAAEKLVSPHLTILIDINPDSTSDIKDVVHSHIDLLIEGAPTTKALIEKIADQLPLSDLAVLNKTIPALIAAGPRKDRQNKAIPLDPHIISLMNASTKVDEEWDLVSRIKTPVAFVRGALSSVCDRNTEIKIANLSSRYIGSKVIPGAGHAINLEQPAALADALAGLTDNTLRSA